MGSSSRATVTGLLLVIAGVALLPLGFGVWHLLPLRSDRPLHLGVHVEPEGGAALSTTDRDRAVAIIDWRINRSGGAGAIVEPSDVPGETIAVAMPTATDPGRAKTLLEAEPSLELRLVASTETPRGYATPEAALAVAARDPIGVEALPYRERDDLGDPSPEISYLPVSKQVVIRGVDLRDVVAVPDPLRGSNYQLNFTLESHAAEALGAWTRSHVGLYLAIVLDGTVRSAPLIQEPITDRGEITGRFTKQQAEDLANVLTAGQMPGHVTVVSETIIASDRQRFAYAMLGAVFALIALICMAGAFVART